MQIVIYKSEVLFDLQNKSHAEVQAISDVEARYRAEAGNDKLEEIFRCMSEVTVRLSKLCRKYLREYRQQEADDQLSLPEAFVYDLNLSDRREANKTQALADEMHDYIVHYTLAKFYASVSQGDLSNQHSLLAQDVANNITELLLYKTAPII